MTDVKQYQYKIFSIQGHYSWNTQPEAMAVHAQKHTRCSSIVHGSCLQGLPPASEHHQIMLYELGLLPKVVNLIQFTYYENTVASL